MSVVKAKWTSKKSKEEFERKDETQEMVEKSIVLWQEHAIIYNIKHPQYTDKTKRKSAVENKREGFEKSGFINPLSADMIIGKINSLRSHYAIQGK